MKSIAEALGQAATQAPQPMQAAASMASSAFSFGTGTAFPSGALPVETETKPPAAMIRSRALRSTIRSLTTGKALARQGSITSVSPSWKVRMWSWQAVVRVRGPWARPLTTRLQVPQMPSRQSWSKAIGSSPFWVELLVHDVEHLEEGHVGADVLRLVGDEAPLVGGVLLPPDVQGEVHALAVAAHL